MNRCQHRLLRWLAIALSLLLLPEIGGQEVHGQLEQPGGPVSEPKSKPVPVPTIEVGKTLFVRDWTKHKPERGDGLGPMYNAVSCVACHKEGGTGGSGTNDANVDLLSVVSPRPKRGRPLSSQASERLSEVHPDFTQSQLSVTVHKSGRDAQGMTGTYLAFRSSLPGAELAPVFSLKNPRRMKRGFLLEFSQRSTPALFGAGLIDQVSDRDLIELARHQAENVPGISGRVPQTVSASVGRFGWRGQVGTLHDFVLGACVNELGLQVAANRSEPQNPVDTMKKANAAGSKEFDLTVHETQSLTAFIGSLPEPKILNGTTLDQSRAVLDGEKLFHRVGCVDCHVEDVGPAKGIFSDLLLHDMGLALADEMAAVPELNERTAPGLASYYGSSSIELLVKVTTNIRQEWRTPPLWGVADSGPWLHDGRADTLDRAIRLHGGESSSASRKFVSLTQPNRARLLSFLRSLRAPGTKPERVFFPQSPFNNGLGGGAGSGFFSGKFGFSGNISGSSGQPANR